MNYNSIFEKNWNDYLKENPNPSFLMFGYIKECARKMAIESMKVVLDDLENKIKTTNKLSITTKSVKGCGFKETRNELIKMMRNALETKMNPNMAINLVDACVIASWDYFAEKEA